MSSLIAGTPRPNRIPNMPAPKFNLSIITHSEMCFSKRHENEMTKEQDCSIFCMRPSRKKTGNRRDLGLLEAIVRA